MPLHGLKEMIDPQDRLCRKAESGQTQTTRARTCYITTTLRQLFCINNFLVVIRIIIWEHTDFSQTEMSNLLAPTLFAVILLATTALADANTTCTIFTQIALPYTITGQRVAPANDLGFSCLYSKTSNPKNRSCTFSEFAAISLPPSLNLTSSSNNYTDISTLITNVTGQSYNESASAYFTTINYTTGSSEMTIPFGNTAKLYWHPTMSCVDGTLSGCAADSNVTDGTPVQACRALVTQLPNKTGNASYDFEPVGTLELVITTGESNVSRYAMALGASGAGGRNGPLGTTGLAVLFLGALMLL